MSYSRRNRIKSGIDASLCTGPEREKSKRHNSTQTWKECDDDYRSHPSWVRGAIHFGWSCQWEPRVPAYVERILAPALKPGEIVIMDNLSIHTSKKVQDLIEARGCRLLFLPAYSPDLSPIEEAFS